MSQSSQAAAPKGLDPEAVAAYLEAHPDFFVGRDALLSRLTLPHDTGGAVSLMERQVSVLRDRNRDLRHRMNELLTAARQNDRLFDSSRQLVLRLMETQHRDDLLALVEESLDRDFQVSAYSVILFGDNPSDANVRVVPETEARDALGGLIDSQRIICGVLREHETAFLFGDAASRVRSAAVVPLKAVDSIGVLALGSDDPEQFHKGVGTLFLEFLADALARLLPRVNS